MNILLWVLQIALAGLCIAGGTFLISAFYIYYGDSSPMIYSAAMAIMAAFISYGRFALKPF